MVGDRVLAWDGLVNGRDLAGLRVAGGRSIAPGRLLRSASPHRMTAAGWQACVDHDVRSTLDLRHGWETENAAVPRHLRPPQVTPMAYSIEPEGFIERFRNAGEDWKLATPLYYDEFVEDWSERLEQAVQAILDAPAGGVLVHCFAGRDRAGLVIAVVLALLGVDEDAIVGDHWVSFDREEDLERTLGLKSKSGGVLPLQQDQHAEIMRTFLRSAPATRVFGDRRAEVQAQLIARLV